MLEADVIISLYQIIPEPARPYVMLALAFLYLTVQLAAITPWKWDDKLSGKLTGLSKILKFATGNYGNAKNKDDK